MKTDADGDKIYNHIDFTITDNDNINSCDIEIQCTDDRNVIKVYIGNAEVYAFHNGIDSLHTWQDLIEIALNEIPIISRAPMLLEIDYIRRELYKQEWYKSEPEEETVDIDLTYNNRMEMVDKLQTVSPVYFDNNRLYWMWNHSSKVYHMVDYTDILNKTYDVFGLRIYKSRDKNETLELIQQGGRSRIVTQPNKNMIVFNGCAVNAATGEHTTPTPDCHYTSFIPHDIGDSEDTPIIDKLFVDWMGDLKYTLYEICAYCMLDDYPIHRIFALVGKGRNGKGEFMKLLSRFIGEDNMVASDLELLATNQFATSGLYKKKIAMMGETDHHTLKSTKTLKMLSGGDPIRAEFKGKKDFTFRNTAKLVIATNGLPETTDRTDGNYSRWFTVSFDNQFEEGPSIIDTLPEEEYNNLARKCIRVLKELLERGGFKHEGTIEERARMYEIKSNPVGTFINQCCAIGDDYKVPYWALWESYEEFQDDGGYRKISKSEFSKSIDKILGMKADSVWFSLDEILEFSPNSKKTEGTTWKGFKGIALKKFATEQTELNTDGDNPNRLTEPNQSGLGNKRDTGGVPNRLTNNLLSVENTQCVYSGIGNGKVRLGDIKKHGESITTDSENTDLTEKTEENYTEPTDDIKNPNRDKTPGLGMVRNEIDINTLTKIIMSYKDRLHPSGVIPDFGMFALIVINQNKELKEVYTVEQIEELTRKLSQDGWK